MTRWLDELALGVVLAIASVVMLARGCAMPAPAAAQRHRDGDALLLARICVSEASWACMETGDGAAIYHVLRYRAARRGQPWRVAARAYSPRATGTIAPRTPRGAWVAQLREDGRQPDAWPSRVSWSAYRERWLSVLAEARRVVAEGVASPCAEQPEHWGGRVDRERARRLGMRRIECGPTRNDFYVTARGTR